MAYSVQLNNRYLEGAGEHTASKTVGREIEGEIKRELFPTVLTNMPKLLCFDALQL
jgi:hypothetical protein